MHEIRRIVFTNEELIFAFSAYSRITPNFLPVGKLLSCTPVSGTDTGSGALLKIETPSGISELTYSGTDVLQPLILFCIENNIMLPREGRKSFLVLDSRASIVIDLNLEFDLAFEEAPMTSEDIAKLKDK